MIKYVSERVIRNHLNYLASSLDENVRKQKDLLCVAVVLLIRIALNREVSEVKNKKEANGVVIGIINKKKILI
jgi:hypothetical protein